MLVEFLVFLGWWGGETVADGLISGMEVVDGGVVKKMQPDTRYGQQTGN